MAAGLITLAAVGMSCSSGSGTASTATSTSSLAATSAPTTGAPTTTAPTAAAEKTAYLAQGNAVCRDMNSAQIALDQQPESRADTPAALAHRLKSQADLIAGALQKLQAIPAPPGDETTLADIYAKVQTFLDLTRRAATAVTDGTDAEWAALVDQLDQAVRGGERGLERLRPQRVRKGRPQLLVRVTRRDRRRRAAVGARLCRCGWFG